MSERTATPWERVTRFVQRIARPLEVWSVRRFGRSPLSILFRTPVLLLHTRGRSTGRTRTTPLAHHRDHDGSFLVVGGAAGQTRTPDWVANLRAHPDQITITVDRRRLTARVDELDDSEREAIWPELRARWPRIETYRRRAGREIPVFRFVPAGSAESLREAGSAGPDR